MFLRFAAGVAAVVLLVLPLCVASKDLSKYPCDVFTTEFCFRLPVEASVEYSVPADFGLYKVSKGSSLLATIYVGDAPKRMDGEKPEYISTSKHGVVTMYKAAGSGSGHSEIYFVPRARGAATVHISATTEPSLRDEVFSLLSGFRSCTGVRPSGQKCSLQGGWGIELARALNRSARG